jgi:ATP-dependent DNA helicase RecG
MTSLTTQDLTLLGESVDLECKLAQGRDGSGEVPLSFWETYSAMANTNGGEVYFGIEETKPGEFRAIGIKNPAKVKKNLWDALHDRDKISRNILNDADISTVLVDNVQVLKIKIQRAKRHDRPVYIGKNPIGNTYVRRHEGDYRADDETVKRMIAESMEDSRDDRILEHFGINDLEKETVSNYRNKFSAVKPDSPWLDLPVEEFLLRIGAMGKDRETGKTGVRIAGLLIFGRIETIRDVFPNYMVDYQERSEPKAENRWIDRVIPDGTWSGNLYDFFQKVYRKLTVSIKVPFRLREGVRTDDTPIHEAIREALTNTLIHSDFSGRVSVLVVKRPDMFGFRNPGLMRISVEQAVHGGISDCRNRRIQDMFRYVGLGDHAGSGIPKIYRNWKEQHWRLPLLYEDQKYEQTLLELRMISLMPEESIKKLDETFGDNFRSLPELERLILITAVTERMVHHSRIKEISSEHPKDITTAFMHLVQNEMLVKEGETRAAVYHLPGQKPTELSLSFLDSIQGDSPDKEPNSPDKEPNSPDKEPNSPDKDEKLKNLIESMGLRKLPKRLKPETMQQIILKLCTGAPLTLKELCNCLGRKPKAFQNEYLTPMVAEKKLVLKYPDIRNHPEQAYLTNA